mgnify:CR=1 FL=1
MLLTLDKIKFQKVRVFDREKVGIMSSCLLNQNRVIAFGECEHSWQGFSNALNKEIRFFDVADLQPRGTTFF